MNGTGKLIKLLVRQNALKITIWIISIVATTVSVAFAYGDVYKTKEELYGFALTMDNPAMKAMLGPGYDVEKYNLGAALATEMLLFTAIAIIIMNILFVSSSTRKDEEEGRLEMIRALPTGRLSYLMASGIKILMLNLLLSILTGIGLGLVGLEGVTWESSFLYGAILGATGLCFAGLTSFFAQLSDTSRGTSSLSFGALIVFYIFRAIGDVSLEGLALISPLGWTVRTGVFVDNEWWPVLALIVTGVIFAGLALYLNIKRDINVGILPTRSGRERALWYLKTSLGLTWKLERNSIIVWTLGIFLMSAAFGAILGDLETYFSDMEYLQAFLPQGDETDMTQRFITMLIQIMSIFTAIPAVLTILRLKKDEKLGLMENFYSRALSRNKVMSSHTIIAFLSTIIMQGSIGLGLYLTSIGVMEQNLVLGNTMVEVFIYLPAIWVIIGLSLLFVGTWSKGSSLVWLYIVFTFIVLYLGNLLDFPQWLNDLSTFNHIPEISQDLINWTPVYALSALALFLGFVGFTGYNKRDIQ
ncbi:ABC transporter permease [Alkalibaculum bacchi]|uniref:ABC transporter permease n=1 Tax=Alkalibaculum bacchi TaxID=645887 RepID=UPI0026ED161D|nr:ABC transporter permease [Alkalibaculum bacchi]